MPLWIRVRAEGNTGHGSRFIKGAKLNNYPLIKLTFNRLANNLIRALSDPYPGAFFNYSNKKIFVWKSKIVNVDLSNLEPGKILYIKKGKPIIKKN